MKQRAQWRLTCAGWTAVVLLLSSGAALGLESDVSEGCVAQKDAEAQVKAILNRVQEGLRTRDPVLLSSRESYFYDDASPDHYVLFDVMPPESDVGAQTLLAKNTKMLAKRSGPTIVYWTDTHVGADCTGAEGSYAFFRGILHSKIRYQDGRSFDATIRHTYVLKKIGGKYLIVHEHGSVPNTAMSIETPVAPVRAEGSPASLSPSPSR